MTVIPVAAKLDEAVRAVCPIEGVSVGNVADKETWRVDFKIEATQGQKNAAQAVVDAFDPANPPAQISPSDNGAALAVRQKAEKKERITALISQGETTEALKLITELI